MSQIEDRIVLDEKRMLCIYTNEHYNTKIKTMNGKVKYIDWLKEQKLRLEDSGRVVEIRKLGNFFSLWSTVEKVEFRMNNDEKYIIDAEGKIHSVEKKGAQNGHNRSQKENG